MGESLASPPSAAPLIDARRPDDELFWNIGILQSTIWHFSCHLPLERCHRQEKSLVGNAPDIAIAITNVE